MRRKPPVRAAATRTVRRAAREDHHDPASSHASLSKSQPGTQSQPVIINGQYACVDSDPTTWSQNTGSGGTGFCKVWVEQTAPTDYSTAG